MGPCRHGVEVRKVIKTETVKEGKSTVFKVSGRLDNITAIQFDADCDKLQSDIGHSLVLDFSDLTYISSAGLRSVLLLGKKLNAKGGHILICGLSQVIKDVFQISGFTSMFPIFQTREEALANT